MSIETRRKHGFRNKESNIVVQCKNLYLDNTIRCYKVFKSKIKVNISYIFELGNQKLEFPILENQWAWIFFNFKFTLIIIIRFIFPLLPNHYLTVFVIFVGNADFLNFISKKNNIHYRSYNSCQFFYQVVPQV